jgi:hypothetical protein
MLQRNLLYTAVTRAQRIVVLVGSRRTLAKAVRAQGAGRRYTALTERLQPQPGRAEPPQGCSLPWDGRLQQVPVEPEERVRGRVRPAERSE